MGWRNARCDGGTREIASRVGCGDVACGVEAGREQVARSPLRREREVVNWDMPRRGRWDLARLARLMAAMSR
eukprot:4274779-Pleurochrysis_carterae.AAC.1